MKILITGAKGQLAQAMITHTASLGQVLALDREHFNLSQSQACLEALDDIQPDLIINTGAYTAVDRAESDIDLAFQVNATMPTQLAEYCQQHACALIHYSTDYVFNGQQSAPYTETDTTDPINVYGLSKREGELGILNTQAPAIILRASWVYSLQGHNFLNTMLKLGSEREELRIVDDQWGSPTWTHSIAAATVALIGSKPQGLSLRDYLHQVKGIYHMTNQSYTSWYGFAQAIFNCCHYPVRLTPIPSSAYPTPAKRPSMSRLDNSKLKQTFDITLPSWHDALIDCLKERP